MMAREVGQTADARIVGRKRRDEKLAEKQWSSDLKAVMSTPSGRRVMTRIILQSRGDGILFQSDARIEAFRLGENNQANWVTRELKANCLAMFRLMEDESIDEENIEKALQQQEDQDERNDS